MNKIETRDVNFWYGNFHALKGISMDIEEKSVVAFIGPSSSTGRTSTPRACRWTNCART